MQKVEGMGGDDKVYRKTGISGIRLFVSAYYICAVYKIIWAIREG